MEDQTSPSVDRRQAMQIGAGLSLVLASLLLITTGSWLSLLLVPAGAVAGLAIGALLNHHPTLRKNARDIRDAIAHFAATLLRPLADERLLVRFASLYLLAFFLFMISWSAAYFALPEGFLASAGNVRLMGQGEAGPFWTELGFIVTRNLPWVVGIALVNLLLGYPPAYLIPLVWVIHYGLLLGTNSFAIPMAQPMAPSLAVLQRAGPYEMSAFLLAAAATYPLSHLSLPWRKVPKEERSFSWRAILLGLLLSAVGIVLAAWREATMIVSSR